jgi:CheY-like chemotaxis protein
MSEIKSAVENTGPKNKQSESTVEHWSKSLLELAKLLPHIAWVLVAGFILFWFATPLRSALEQGVITKVGIGVLQLEITGGRLQKAAEAKSQVIAPGLKQRIERLPRATFDAAILWLDDNPANNVAERRALASLGLTIDTAQTTAEALQMLRGDAYHVVISDLVRNEVPNTPCIKAEGANTDGCELIDHLMRSYEEKNKGRTLERAQPPVIFYARVVDPQRGAPPYGFGMTSRVDELFHLILDALERRPLDNAENK